MIRRQVADTARGNYLLGVPDFHSIAEKDDQFHVSSSGGEFQFPNPTTMRGHRSRNAAYSEKQGGNDVK